MKKAKQKVVGIAASAMVAGAAIVTPMAVSAATPSTTTPRSRVAGYTIRVERQKAVATVLGTTPDQLEQTLKTETLKELLTQKGLSNKDFAQKVRTELVNELNALGYTDDQINASLKGGKPNYKKHHRDNDVE